MESAVEKELEQTGCIFRYHDIRCGNKTQCDKCGWNPWVEAERKKAVQQKMMEAKNRNGMDGMGLS